MPNGLREFLIEYFIYTATLSIISTDAAYSAHCIVSPQLEECAHELVRAKYVGNLCGCWLDLLLLIPRIFSFAGHIFSTTSSSEQEAGLSFDLVAVFATLQNQILNWSPYQSTTTEIALAGRIFQNAILIYLYTSLSIRSPQQDSPLYPLVQDAVKNVMSCLDQLPITAPVNTNLCWPIAVVGSCLETSEQRESVKTRLEMMERTIGLGNIAKTRLLLEELWKLPNTVVTPWTICRGMLEHQIWISFA